VIEVFQTDSCVLCKSTFLQPKALQETEELVEVKTLLVDVWLCR